MPQIERTLGPFLAKDKEFYYLDSDIWVLPKTPYMVYYTKGKKIEYKLEQTDEEILSVRKNSFQMYQKLTGKQRDTYPKKIYPTVKNLPFAQTFISRTFTHNKLIEGSEIYETTAPTNTVSYRFVTFNWQISGPAAQAEMHNKKILQDMERFMPGIAEVIPPLQLHQTRIKIETDVAKLIGRNPLYVNSATPEVLANLKSPVKEKGTIAKRKRKRRRKRKNK